MRWYVTVGGHMDGPGADVTRTAPEINLPALIEYANQRNVGVFVWVHWKALCNTANGCKAAHTGARRQGGRL